MLRVGLRCFHQLGGVVVRRGRPSRVPGTGCVRKIHTAAVVNVRGFRAASFITRSGGGVAAAVVSGEFCNRYAIDELTVSNLLEAFSPRVVTAAMHTTAISATRSAYATRDVIRPGFGGCSVDWIRQAAWA